MNSHRSMHAARLLLFVLFLWAQSAVAIHAVDHEWHDSTEVCQVLKSAEQSKFFLTASVTTPHQDVERLAWVDSLNPTVLAPIIASTARAPPYRFSSPS